jgi:nucleoside-diphosphate-sugar epimerase
MRQASFDRTYNSSNIESIAGEEFDLLVCAGVRAEKWIANANPGADRAAIDRLIQAVSDAKARRAILVSTVDVFMMPLDVDERTPVITAALHTYGKNRYYVEQAFAERFETVVARLPGLYGPGIKKNVIHDFLRDHQTEKIDSRGIFQFYGLGRLWQDLQIALRNHLTVVHLPTAPVSVAEVARTAFGREFMNHVVEHPARYDVYTRHAELFGGSGDYIESKTVELEGIRRFVEREAAR